MKKRLLAALLCVAMTAAMLAGCGGSGGDGKKDDKEKSGGSGKEITYWSMWNSTENQAKVIQEAADAYEEETGIHVNIEWKGRDVKTLIGSALDAGEDVDLFDDDYQRVVEQDGKYLVDLTEMAAAADYEKHIMPVILDSAKEWGDGKLLVMPYQPYTTGVCITKTFGKKRALPMRMSRRLMTIFLKCARR